MTALWYIDALDARAGHAFVSLRQPDLGDPDIDLDAPAALILAPDFRPEYLSSRAIGFAAATAGAQAGFFIGGEEVGFPSLRAVAEFVRRAYLSGGAGDGGSGIGPVPPGPPDGGDDSPEGGGDVEERFGKPHGEELATPVSALLTLGGRFRDAVESAGDVGGERSGAPPAKDGAEADDPDSIATASGARRFEAKLEDPSRLYGTVSDLSDGAALVLIGLLHRAPAGADDVKSWHMGLHALGRTILGLGLLPEVLHGAYREELRRAALQAEARDSRIFGDYGPSVSDSVGVVAGLWFALPVHRYYALDWWHLVEQGEASFMPGHAATSGDPHDHLGAWPIPGRVARHARLGKEDSSLRGLLAAAAADPTLIAPGAPEARESAALMLLAAVHLTRDASSGGGISSGSGTLVTAVVADALEWLERQMPAYSFAPEVEQAIGRTSSLRYAAA